LTPNILIIHCIDGFFFSLNQKSYGHTGKMGKKVSLGFLSVSCIAPFSFVLGFGFHMSSTSTAGKDLMKNT
jgi:hypothetical protein